MNVTSVAISVLITVKLDDLNSHSAAAAEIVGEEMARQVAGYTQKKKLGYYPPLEYFKELDDVDPDLIDAIDNVAWLATRLVREEVRRRLRPVFASLRIDALQNLVFTMPRVRPGNASSMQQLTEHFTPNKVRIELTASIINRDTTEKDFKRYTSHLVHRWLADHFENVDVVSCRQTGANAGKSNTS